MKIPVKNLQGADQGEVEVRFAFIEGEKGVQAVHDTVTAYRAAQRSGTASTKTVGEVAGTNKKPWRQKGTGRARAGSFASPLWRGGGVVFGPKPRDFRKKVNRQTRRVALQKAFGERLNAGDVIVVDELKLDSPKTRAFLELLGKFDIEKKKNVLIVSDAFEENVRLASRNIGHVELSSSRDVNCYQALRADKILFTRQGFEEFNKRMNPESASQ